MEYKRQYTQAELQELKEWYVSHQDKLPETFQKDDATFYADLKETVVTIIDLLDTNGENVTFSGLLHQFFELHDRLVEAGY